MKGTGSKVVAAVLALLLAGYLAWCGRVFYLKPQLVFPADMPEEYQQMALDWHQANDLPKSEPWSWRRFSAELRYPFRQPARPTLPVASLHEDGAVIFACYHDDMVYGIEVKADGGQAEEKVVDF